MLKEYTKVSLITFCTTVLLQGCTVSQIPNNSLNSSEVKEKKHFNVKKSMDNFTLDKAKITFAWDKDKTEISSYDLQISKPSEKARGDAITVNNNKERGFTLVFEDYKNIKNIFLIKQDIHKNRTKQEIKSDYYELKNVETGEKYTVQIVADNGNMLLTQVLNIK